MQLRPLSTRIAVSAGLLALVGVGLLSFMLIRSQRRQVLAEVVHSSESIAETIRLSINHDMLANRQDGVREVIASMGQHAGMAGVRLFNKEGRVSYSSRPEEVGRIVDKRAEACIECHRESEPYAQLDLADRSRVYTDPGGHEILSTIHVIRNEAACAAAGCHVSPAVQRVLGVLDVGLELEPAQARLGVATRNAAFISLGALILITGPLVLLVRRSVRQPVEQLIAATRRVASGDYEHPVPSVATDEIGFLARSFNEMVESLSISQHELERKMAQKAVELRTTQFQVVQAEKLSSVGLVAAGIAHELNSPLMAITTFGHMVLKRLAPESQEYADVEMILHEADRCAAIVRTLLDFSRDQTATPQIELCDVGRLLDRSLEILKVEIKSRGVETDLSVPADVPPVEVNAVQLTQVFVNLLLNAIQAMPDGGRITITADQADRRAFPGVTLPPAPSAETGLVRITFRDTGPGIPPDALDRIFDPFYTTKPVGQGSGLGLSVSQAIITRYRGGILASSDGATGTAFTVLLPAAVPVAVPA